MSEKSAPSIAPIQGHCAPQEITQIAYCCRLLPLAKGQSMRHWIEQEAHDLAQAQITGLLVWNKSLAIEWIEGATEQVGQVWQNRQNEKRRHSIVQLLHRTEPSERLFSTWSAHTANRQDMLDLLREMQNLATQDQSLNAAPSKTQTWLHALQNLNIILDPGLESYYLEYPQNASQPPDEPATIKGSR